MATIGMMDSAYFVGRQEILNWLNSFLQLNYTKIEDTMNGAASCQIMDALHPGSIPLSRVDYNAQREFECLQNYQLLQDAFAKVGIEKTIPVNDLCRGKYRDNLEWMQWLKRYFGLHWSDDAKYDARARRRETKCFYAGDVPVHAPVSQQQKPGATLGARVTAARIPQSQLVASLATPQRTQSHSVISNRSVTHTQARAPRPSLPANTRPMVSHATTDANPRATSPPSTQPTASKTVPGATASVPMRDSTNSAAASTSGSLSNTNSPVEASTAPQRAQLQQVHAQLAEARTQNAQLRALLDTVEKERDFYFAKLRQIEIWCDQRQSAPSHSSEDIVAKRIMSSIQAILYKPDV